MSDGGNIEGPKSWKECLSTLKKQPTLCIIGYDFQAEFNMPHFKDTICGVWSEPESALNPFSSEASYHTVMNWLSWRKKIICQFEHPERIPKFAQQQSLAQLLELQQLLGFDIVDQTPSGFLATNRLGVIHEVYGNIKRAKCHGCGKRSESWQYVAATKKIITCEECGGRVFPDISMFGWNEQFDTKSILAKRLSEVENLLCIGADFNLHPFVEAKAIIQQKHLAEVKPKKVVFDNGKQVISIKEIAKILGYREADFKALEKTPPTLEEGLSFFYRLCGVKSGENG